MLLRENFLVLSMRVSDCRFEFVVFELTLAAQWCDSDLDAPLDQQLQLSPRVYEV